MTLQIKFMLAILVSYVTSKRTVFGIDIDFSDLLQTLLNNWHKLPVGCWGMTCVKSACHCLLSCNLIWLARLVVDKHPYCRCYKHVQAEKCLRLRSSSVSRWSVQSFVFQRVSNYRRFLFFFFTKWSFLFYFFPYPHTYKPYAFFLSMQFSWCDYTQPIFRILIFEFQKYFEYKCLCSHSVTCQQVILAYFCAI